MSIAVITHKTGAANFRESDSYRIVGDGYCFENYDKLPIFCSFLPGIGGLKGVPLWAMYLNRGQGISSFGMRGKDNAVMEFFPATMAWQLVPLYGFRTFVRIGGRLWEPFGSGGKSDTIRRMFVHPHTLRIVEENPEAGLETTVSYVTVPGSINPALLRTVTLRNTSGKSLSLEVLDGMPVVVPAGVNDYSLKKQRRITEAFCRVSPEGENMALFALPVSAEDTAEVQAVKEASFYAAWSRANGDPADCRLVIDPDVVFGPGEDFVQPRVFATQWPFDPTEQNWENRLACAFAHTAVTLPPEGELRIDALSGYAQNRDTLAELVTRVSTDFDRVHAEARQVVRDVTEPATAATALPHLDGYLRNTFLDNALRGGIPILFPSASGPQPVHVYTRRHGDMERDYNEFDLPPLPYSEGSGNFRDILQNRRSDVLFFPEIGETELRYFLSILQPDGYNPLAIEGCRWRAKNASFLSGLLPANVSTEARREIETMVLRNFTPGEAQQWAEAHLADSSAHDQFVKALLERCEARVSYRPPHEGYWIDHWVYLLDLIEAFQSVYPDRLAELMAGDEDFAWAECTHGLIRRGDRLVLEPLAEATTLPPLNLMARLASLAAIKALTLDAQGRGIEMEAGRPGWNDALNGLPGLRGSSTCETAALQRLSDWMLEYWPQDAPSFTVPKLIGDLLATAGALCRAPRWDYQVAVSARESFRNQFYTGGGRQDVLISPAAIRETLEAISHRAKSGMEESRVENSAMVNTYFYREGESVKPMPLFLEGQVHLLRLKQGRERAAQVYRELKESDLFDEQLQMYKVNASLRECPYAIGRARTFSPGMYENESIWLHMSYKYLLELLRCGLHKEFFADCRTMLVPFMDPAVYGRSILENCSFLGSSACPEKGVQGRGLVARLSGSTAEFLHIWLLLMLGERPFRCNDGELSLHLNPILPAEWFRLEATELAFRGQTIPLPGHCIASAFLGTILLVYHNPLARSTFGRDAVKPVSFVVDGEEHHGPALHGAIVEKIRRRQVRRIDVHLS